MMAEEPAPARPSFEADASSTADDVVVAGDGMGPAAKGLSALARFEFESGKSNEGTKILMVEWEENNGDGEQKPGSGGIGGEWHVQWEGKSTVLQVKDKEDRHHRLYFLLPYGVTIPPTITLTRKPLPSAADQEETTLTIHPLPALFPPTLGAFARSAGKKGVLHTIWAKKRLSVLQAEIDKETKENVESVGLEMALQEKAWIEQNFGVGAGARMTVTIPTGGAGMGGGLPASPLSPTKSPTTPGGSRLAEKLKGLRLGTSPAELSTARQARSTVTELPPTAPPTAGQPGEAHQPTSSIHAMQHPLSPETSDVAISSFSAFHGTAPRQQTSTQLRSFAAQLPPASILAQQSQQHSSLAGALSSAPPVPFNAPSCAPVQTADEDEEEEGGLFAVAMSPRSPDMARSPFSFSFPQEGGRVGGIPWK